MHLYQIRTLKGIDGICSRQLMHTHKTKHAIEQFHTTAALRIRASPSSNVACRYPSLGGDASRVRCDEGDNTAVGTVYTMLGALKMLGWACNVLGMIMYMFCVGFTEACKIELAGSRWDNEPEKDLTIT
eukprot:TRINITY_DN68065_c0_g1_i1.p2 TRINITY_DN68065_c0_g1~~TRINITY_DN68065_c0_g1_i1.p2  ORF type:complete len:129 (-),score=5.42 TRINITY_DN68065_c0_g1_i1:10-396(-)